MSQVYNVESQNVGKLFASDAVYRVPVFQRRYAWGAREVGALFSDVFGEQPRERGKGGGAPYFLGSIVVAWDGKDLLVLDGQQRLTTIALLFAVFKDKLEELGHEDSWILEGPLFINDLIEGRSARVLLQDEDAKHFQHLVGKVEDCELPRFRRVALAKALKTIRDSVEETLDGQSQDRQLKLVLQMSDRLLKDVEVVLITAQSQEHAFLLFETLNDRGLPLNSADLVKNELLARSGKKHLDQTLAYWSEITDLVGAKELVTFLRHYWVAFQGPVSKAKLYPEVKQHLESLGQPGVCDFAKKLRDYAEMYQQIVDPEEGYWGSDCAATLKRLRAYRAASCRPLLLLCAAARREHVAEVARLLETATVRHTLIADLNPNKLEKLYVALCSDLRNQEHDFAALVTRRVRAVLPGDTEFKESFAAHQTGSNLSAIRALLLGLNQQRSTGETEVKGPGEVHVEHILPRRPSVDCLAECGLTEEEAQEWSGRIGNLTLVHAKINRSISNGPFSTKKPQLGTSEIALNRDVVSEKKWGRAEIEARGRSLAELAAEIWPCPVEEREFVAAE